MSSAGSQPTTTTLHLDWTLGELAITGIADASHAITQGFHQPSLLTTATREWPAASGQVRVFPNPTASTLNVHLALAQPQSVTARLFNALGQQLWSRQLQGRDLAHEEDLSPLPAGTYILQLRLAATNHYANFKIVKTH